MIALPKIKLPALKPRAIRAYVPLEHDIQVAFVRICQLAERATMPLLRLGFAVPNGGQRSKAVAGKLKAEGVRAGVPDWMLPVPASGFAGLAIEFKRPGKVGNTSEAQDTYINDLKAVGWLVVICTCPVAAFDVVKNYLAPAR